MNQAVEITFLNKSQPRTIPKTPQKPTRSRPLTMVHFLYMNAFSIVNKINLLNALLKSDSNDFSFIFITETWLKPLYTDSYIVDSNNYSVLRNDRLNKKGGGVCVIYKNSLASDRFVLEGDSFGY